jgi:TonB family protein
MKLAALPRVIGILIALASLFLGVGYQNSAKADTRAPQARTKANPTYPFEQRRTGVEGFVTVAFTVDRAGRTRDITVVNASHEEFVEPAVHAVRKWSYQPALVNGVAVATSLQETVHFRIDPNG